MLLSFSPVSPITVLVLGVSLRDRAALPSPLRGLRPSGGHPSRLRPLRELRGPLARRLASLTAACVSVTVVQRVSIRVLPRPTSALAFASLALAGCAGLGLRLGSPAFAFANTVLRAAASRPARSRATAAALRFRFRNRSPRRSVPWVRSFSRPSAARLSHPTQRAAQSVKTYIPQRPTSRTTCFLLHPGTTKSCW